MSHLKILAIEIFFFEVIKRCGLPCFGDTLSDVTIEAVLNDERHASVGEIELAVELSDLYVLFYASCDVGASAVVAALE